MKRTKLPNMREQLHINIQASNYTLTKKKHEGKEYLLVPVTMMVEGVHHGNQGPIFHSIDELGKIPDSWNGIPIVINHPQKDGHAISANIPEVLAESAVGVIFGTFVEDTKLKATAWLEEAKVKIVCPELLDILTEGDPMEVSVGVFTDYDETAGTWNDEDYTKVAINHRPDHLAILPKMVGACSLADGCGIGFSVNAAGKAVLEVNAEQLTKTIQILNRMGMVTHSVSIYESGPSYREIMDQIYNKFREMDGKDTYHYVEELYADCVVFNKHSQDKQQMYKQEYKFESGKIELIGNPVEVHRKVEYVVNQININSKKEVSIMANECTPCIKKKVDELIANSQGRWAEDDRAFLETLDEAKLNKFAPQVVEKVVEKEVQVNVLSKEDQEALATFKAEKKTKRDQMVKDIQANSSKELWPDETLNAMSDDTLTRVFSSVKKEEVVDYSFAGAGSEMQVNVGDAEPMLPAGFGQTTK